LSALSAALLNRRHLNAGFFIAYSRDSGGIYLDCGIHDIDIARWFLNVTEAGKKQVTRVYASGVNVRHPELAKFGDADNALGTVEFANGTMCTFHLSRTANHGHDCFTEVFGGNGKIVVNGVSRAPSTRVGIRSSYDDGFVKNPSIDRVEIRDEFGVRTLST